MYVSGQKTCSNAVRVLLSHMGENVDKDGKNSSKLTKPTRHNKV